MPLYTPESLELLRQRIDLVEVLSSHIELKKTGAFYKALCPFHDEKTASFGVQKGDSHYHCFGCGAHGDAIQFLISFLRMSFAEAVETLAEKFHVHLEHVEQVDAPKGPSKILLREVLETACQFYHFFLLNTEEGHQALSYLHERGLDLEFVHQFQIGLAPNAPAMLYKVLEAKGYKLEIAEAAGLTAQYAERGIRDFFHDRITFPIRDVAGSVIGFSARKYKELTQGGKYVNTPETPLFKKSKILFGLNYCRKRITKEKFALIVEGQIDALRLIQCGYNFTVAGQGTAFGEAHAHELLQLGVNRLFLALDGDLAGREAAVKIGNIFQRFGSEVHIVQMPDGSDPDGFLKAEGSEKFLQLLTQSQDYLTFLVHHLSQKESTQSPAEKNRLIESIANQIRSWDHPVMVHESLQKLAHLTQTPRELIDASQTYTPNVYIKKSSIGGMQSVDHDRVIESDLIRLLLMLGGQIPDLVRLAQLNVKVNLFKIPVCKQIYEIYLDRHAKALSTDLLSLAVEAKNPDAQELLASLFNKKVNKERALQHLQEAVRKILDREWMGRREEVRMKISKEGHSEQELALLLKEFEELKRTPPTIVYPSPLRNSNGI